MYQTEDRNKKISIKLSLFQLMHTIIKVTKY